MKIKHYIATKDQVCKYLYSMNWHQQMIFNYTFGVKAQEAGMTAIDYIFYLIEIGEFRYRGKPVRLKS